METTEKTKVRVIIWQEYANGNPRFTYQREAITDNPAEFIAQKLWHIFSLQCQIRDKSGKHFFFGLAKSRPFSFLIEFDGKVIDSTKLRESGNMFNKLKIDNLNEEGLKAIIDAVIKYLEL